MSTLDINAIRDYLLEVGCKIEYQILVHAFKKHLYNENPEVQGLIRTQFKDYVNRLATVSLENNMKFIILRPEFRPSAMTHTNTSTQQQQQQPLSQPNQGKTNEVIKLPRQQNQQMALLQPSSEPNSPSRLPAQHIPPPPIPEHRTTQQVLEAQHSPTVFFPQQQQPIMIARRRREQPLTPQSVQQISHSQDYNNIKVHQQQQQQQPPVQSPSTPKVQSQVELIPPNSAKLTNSSDTIDDYQRTHRDVQDGLQMLPPPNPPPVAQRTSHLSQRPESLNLTSPSCQPPRPPPRRRQSTASLFKPPTTITTSHQSTLEKSREIHDLAKKSPGRVKEHALKLNSFTSSTDISALTPIRRNNIMKENNRLSRDPSIAGSLASALQRNGSHLTNRSRSSHREDESDSSSLQPIDPLRRRWSIEACNCNYNGLIALLREDSKLAHYKDIVNGYTALHWAAKFGNLDIIKLIAGNHSVSANIKSSAGYTPLHIARMFNRNEAADLLLKSYKANPNIRDHSGKKPAQYSKSVVSSNC